MTPANSQPVPFDSTDKAFLEAYFDIVLRGHEDIGVDLWWVDWQQGVWSKTPGVDPLWMLNHFHFLDRSRRNGREPATLSRYAGPGSHRYPLGFSGDTYTTWKSLAYQPEFTATAANIGYGWWSHDIGGHLPGYKVRQDRILRALTDEPGRRAHGTMVSARRMVARVADALQQQPIYDARTMAIQHRGAASHGRCVAAASPSHTVHVHHGC